MHVVQPEHLVRVSTASHGGYWISDALKADMPADLRGANAYGRGNWYEEDCEWALIALALPDIFCQGLQPGVDRAKVMSAAWSTARSTYPALWDKHWREWLVRDALTLIETGNLCPNVCRDSTGLAYFEDGSPIGPNDIATADPDDAVVLVDVLLAHGLKAHDQTSLYRFRSSETRSYAGRRS